MHIVCFVNNCLTIIGSGGEITQLPQLLLCMCEVVQDEALALIDSTRHMIQKGDVQEDSMETDSPHFQKDQRDSVSVLRRVVFLCITCTNMLLALYPSMHFTCPDISNSFIGLKTL